jgi:hypothetical protein
MVESVFSSYMTNEVGTRLGSRYFGTDDFLAALFDCSYISREIFGAGIYIGFLCRAPKGIMLTT